MARACIGALAVLAMPLTGASDRYAVGNDHYFNREYEPAVRSFRRLVEQEPEDPTAHVLLAKSLLYRELDRLRMVGTSAFRGDKEYNSVVKPKPDPKFSAVIREALSGGRALCERRLETNPDDRESLHALAQLLALRAGFEIFVGKAYFRALANGRRARVASYRVGELYPEFVDGLLVAGVDEYILGSLPWAARVLVALSGYHGNRKKGAEIIARVAREGQENRDDARLLFAMLHRRERRSAEAANVFGSLAADFPRAYTFALESAAMHVAAGNKREALAAFREVERKRVAGEDRYDRMPARLAAALARRIKELERGRPSEADRPPRGAFYAAPTNRLENSLSSDSLAAAAPESIASAARAAPSRQLSAFPATRSAAPAFMTTISRAGPGLPPSTARMVDAFARASPPAISLVEVPRNPKSSGSRVPRLTSPFRTSA